MIHSSITAMTTAEAIVASVFIASVAAVVLVVVWQLFAIARNGARGEGDRRPGQPIEQHDQPRSR